jgi:anti-sigma B factor antagonist
VAQSRETEPIRDQHEEEFVQISLSQSGEYGVVSVEGRMDTVSAPDFEKQVLTWIDEGRTLFIIDLSNLEYISSAGLRSLMVAAKASVTHGGRICCCGLTGIVQQVFDVSGFSKVLPVFDSREVALERWRF